MMADRETLLAINAQLMSKLKEGTATDDDLNTLKAVMSLLEKEAAKVVEKRSISSSVPQTGTIGEMDQRRGRIGCERENYRQAKTTPILGYPNQIGTQVSVAADQERVRRADRIPARMYTKRWRRARVV